jgi:hypothetical protein
MLSAGRALFCVHCRLRVEEAGRERVRGLLRLVVQRHMQVRRQDEDHPQRLRRRRRRRLERRHLIRS